MTYYEYSMNITQQKGIASELKCQLFFVERGYNVYVPISEDSRCDMILNVNDILYRIQIKTGRETKTKTGIEFNTCSMRMNHTEGNIRVKYSENEVDFFMVSFKDNLYLVPIQECLGSQRTLCYFQNGKNLLASDYEAEKILQQLEKDYEVIETSHPLKKGVIKMDIKTKEVLQTYSSFADAARDLGDVKKTGHISQAARGQRKTAYGFAWRII